jgi:hypothetical protein
MQLFMSLNEPTDRLTNGFPCTHCALTANASYALNLVHCYEIANRHQEAFRATKDFLRSNGDARVGQHGLSNRSVLEGMRRLRIGCSPSVPIS